MSMDHREAVDGLLAFLKESPTAFHAVRAAGERLAGWQRLRETDAWRLQPGGRYFVERNGSSLIAFALPEGGAESFQMIAAHSDSPTFKIKENAELVPRDRYTRLDVERYGGTIFTSWFDRPLSVAGRVLVREGDAIQTRLVCLDRDMCVIPNVAIHMNREVNNGCKYQANVDVMPLWGTGKAAGSFRRVIAESAGAREEDLLGSDLYLFSRVPGTVWGEENAFVSAGRLDDLECVYAALSAVTRAPAEGHVNVCCIFDNEEVGSGTRQGADSTFLSETLRRVTAALGGDEEHWSRMLASSFMLSADNAHATHPNHPEYADPVNQVFMNEGVVVKFNANQKYTTDGATEAVFREVCRRAEVPVQFYANRSDLAGGSTLGHLSGSHVSVDTVDIGLAQLAMHSSWETAGTRDLGWMIDAMTRFYAAHITKPADGAFRIYG